MIKRIIPCLLLKNGGLVKTVNFSKPSYVGDPINAVKIFNDKGADELVILDIEATKNGKQPDYDKIKDIVSEAFMPIGYGGGITSIDQVEKILKLGVEKVILNASAFLKPQLIKDIAEAFGSSTVVGSMDVKKKLLGGKSVFVKNASVNTKKSPIEYAKYLEDLGVGEILVNDVNKDGTLSGMDSAIFTSIADSVDVPVVACGGAKTEDEIINLLINTNLSAISAGAKFVYHGPHRAVLINYPDEQVLDQLREYNEKTA
jgi:cyclase